jgi:serine/threonine-protein kinase
MELVEGPTLQERLARGPLPPEEALSIARQLAEALEYAHERGIVHRDLKPANVKLRTDGAVRCSTSDSPARSTSTLGRRRAISHAISHDLRTLTQDMTGAGLILGTAAYMSPEQARGGKADRARRHLGVRRRRLRDVLSGKKAFAGETISETLAAVIRDDPDWSGASSRTFAPMGSPPPPVPGEGS